MPAIPAEPIDRLAAVETRLSAIEAEAAHTRRRNAEKTTYRETWPAITQEHTDSAQKYPRYNSSTANLLPIVFLDGDDCDTPRSAEPRQKAVSTVGWLPPGTRVDVALVRGQYRIVRAPSTLAAYAMQAIPAASGTRNARQRSTGRGQVQIAQLSAGKYLPQTYRDGTPVLHVWDNHCDSTVPINLLVFGNEDRDQRWLIEFCCECDSSESSSEPSSSESSSPSSSWNMCQGFSCIWAWYAEHWVASHTCFEPDCHCVPSEPPSPGEYEGQTFFGTCTPT